MSDQLPATTSNGKDFSWVEEATSACAPRAGALTTSCSHRACANAAGGGNAGTPTPNTVHANWKHKAPISGGSGSGKRKPATERKNGHRRANIKRMHYR